MNASAVNPPDTAPKKMLARPFDSAIVADRAPCKTKCSVVTKVTTAGLTPSGIAGACPTGGAEPGSGLLGVPAAVTRGPGVVSSIDPSSLRLGPARLVEA